MSTRVYTITGMTCGHCVSSITEQVRRVAGVSGVSVDLTQATATVQGEGFADEAVRAAVAEAGYTLTGRRG